MKQITQNLKSGKMTLLEVPVPSVDKGQILVRNHYSLISAGTEGSKVATARKGYIGKAKEKPEAVKQVLDTIKTEGLKSTYQKVMNKLDAPSPLGYSCAGEVVAVGDGANDIHMLARAGLGIAFNAKSIVQKHANAGINQSNLELILYFLGISGKELQELREVSKSSPKTDW